MVKEGLGQSEEQGTIEVKAEGTEMEATTRESE